jgi:hypothetical protein
VAYQAALVRLTAVGAVMCACVIACAGGDEVAQQRQAAQTSSQHRDRALGWTVDVRSGFRVSRFHRFIGMALIRGSVLANFPLEDKPLAALGQMPRDGAALLISHNARFPAGRGPFGQDTTFPLRLADLPLTPLQAALVARANVTANGLAFTVRAFIGDGTSRDDRRALARMVQSLRFARLRPGTISDSAFYVLGPTRKFQARTVTFFSREKQPPSDILWREDFFLVHAPRGFYAVGFKANYVGGFPDCDLAFNAARFQFTCPNGARWDRIGRVLAPPRGRNYRSTPLAIYSTRTTHDGKVIVSTNAYTHGSRQLAHRFWGT